MSHLRGLFPIAFATVLGVGNGIWVFGPAFKEQQQEKEDQAKKALEATKHSEHGPLESKKRAEAAAGAAAGQASPIAAASKALGNPKP
ncbi:hypothetical protein BUE80_DR013684 [Diplocarpon rosae]|nr:hypothetical protein BUE80_DR013684 [Diplocarpon rosae]